MKLPFHQLIILLTSLLVNGCVSHQSLISFDEEGQPTPAMEDILNQMDLRIQPEDLLRIEVFSSDPKAAAPYNIEPQDPMFMQARAQQTQNTQTLELFTGYFVDQDGNIDMPSLGPIEVEGLTIEEAKSKIVELLKPYIIDPVVSMRFLNFKITVLGEVNRPGMIRLTNKRVTLLEALGMAGDLTVYANRTNILITREENGARTYARLNLQDFDIFNSPYFYLQQNDVIYVEPQRARIATVADPAQRLISYSSGLISVITLIIALTK